MDEGARRSAAVVPREWWIVTSDTGEALLVRVREFLGSERSVKVQGHSILAELHTSKEAYQTFFTRLAGGVQGAVQRQSATIRSLEEGRLADVQAAQAQHEETLLRLAEEDGVWSMCAVYSTWLASIPLPGVDGVTYGAWQQPPSCAQP